MAPMASGKLNDIARTVDQHGSKVLERSECMRLLARTAKEKGVGRLGINLADGPHIAPVNFSVSEGEVIVRLGPGHLSAHLDDAKVAFEIDHAEAYSRRGWSVLVRGVAHLLAEKEAIALGRSRPVSFVTRPGLQVFSIGADIVSGRAVHAEDLAIDAYRTAMSTWILD